MEPSQTTQMKTQTRAFVRDQGQYVLHLYVNLTQDECLQTIGDIIECIETEQLSSNEPQGWQTIKPAGSNDSDTKSSLHITLIRGHRAIYYHQIKPLVSAFKSYCRQVKPIGLCLDELRIFKNHEQTSQFLCLATRASNSQQSKTLEVFKRQFVNIVDQFAERLTDENETNDTQAHCSFMFRHDLIEESYMLDHLRSMCLAKLDGLPICVVRIDKIEMRIGKQVYSFDLTG